MRTIYLLFLLGIALLLPASLHARGHEGWTTTNFNNENGLPQNSIHYVEMDNDGYLWMATQSGIVRYDGQRFRLFDNNNSALRNNRYWAFGKDRNGSIYCIDASLQTSFYNNKTGFSKPASIPGISPSADGGLIDLSRINITKMLPTIYNYTHGQYPIGSDFIYYAMGKNKGFLVWRYGTCGYVSGGKVNLADSIDLYTNTTMAIGCLGDKLCYINKQKYLVLLDSNGVRTYKKIPLHVPWDKVQLYATTIAFFRQNDQTLLSVDGDIYEVKIVDDELVLHHLIEVKDIPYITCIRYYPGQNLMVIGSGTQGLFLLKKQQLASVGKNHWSAQNSFYALTQFGNNQVVATTGVLPHSPAVPGINEPINRFTILRDHNAHYWYSSGHTLLETNERFGILRKVPILPEGTVCIKEDELGTIWLTQGHHDFGSIQGGTFQPYKLDSLDGQGIKTINTFVPAGDQTFWLVGYHVCMLLDVKHHRQRIYHEFDSAELRASYIDKKGNLWVGSYGQGYFLFRNGGFIRMPEDKERALGIVHCFLEDNNGFIWMTTNNGMFQCAINDLYNYADGKTRQVYHHYYGKENGMKTSEFNGGCTPSGIQLDNGGFAFPSMNGVVLFHPDSIKPLLPANKLFIDQVLLDGLAIQDHDLSKIPPSFRRLEFTVSSPYFGDPRNLNIQYNIDGLDDQWYSLGENSRIVLNRLKYGHYKLRLRKEAGFGTGNYTVTELPLVVVPFFYQTWWFRILVVLFVLLLILVSVRIRYRYLIHQRNRLEAEVKDRTQAVVYHNKLLEKLTVMIAHDLKSPLHFLSKVTGHLRSKVQQENLHDVERVSNEIKNTADHVYQFIEDFNLWVSSFSGGFTAHRTSFALNGLLSELQLFFAEMLEDNGNRLFITTECNYNLVTDRELLKVILRNIIDNANKHAKPCDISISAHAENETNIIITITDTGEGMSKPALKRIQDRIALASTAAGIERNSRMGYQMIIDFVTHLSAKLDVMSEQGKGTTVTLCIPGRVSETSPAPQLTEQVVSAG